MLDEEEKKEEICAKWDNIPVLGRVRRLPLLVMATESSRAWPPHLSPLSQLGLALPGWPNPNRP